MKLVESITSNATGMFACEEVTPGVIPQDGVWTEKEPNSYANFGSELKTVQRMPINANRRNKKGTVVGFTAGAGYETDLTADNLRDDMQGFFFADLRRKSRIVASAVLNDGFTVPAGGAAYVAGTLLTAVGSTIAGNNGMFKAAAGSGANKVAVAGLTAVAAQEVTIRRVGIEFAAGDAAIVNEGGLPALETAAFDMTTLGVIPGEIVYLGGDAAATTFGDAGRGWCRVKSVAANVMVFDKTDFAFAPNDGAGKTIRLFFGEVIRDEDAALQKTRSYSIMRQLGRPDSDAPNAVQAEVVTRCVASKLSLKVPEEDKITADLSFMGGDVVYFKDLGTELAGADYVGVVEADAINSTGDMKRAVMTVYPDAPNSSPAPLLAVFNSFNLDFDNNIKENKAVTRLGTFVLSPGNFGVSGTFTGYFVTVEALKAVRNNADVSFMMAAYKGGKGVALDLPLLSLATKGLDVKMNEPVMIPIDTDAATGRKYDANMAHTALMVFFDYLPEVAND